MCSDLLSYFCIDVDLMYHEVWKVNLHLLHLLFCFQMYNIYIKRAAEIYGITHTRSIYEKAIEVLPNEQARWVFCTSLHGMTFPLQNTLSGLIQI